MLMTQLRIQTVKMFNSFRKYRNKWKGSFQMVLYELYNPDKSQLLLTSKDEASIKSITPT